MSDWVKFEDVEKLMDRMHEISIGTERVYMQEDVYDILNELHTFDIEDAMVEEGLGDLPV